MAASSKKAKANSSNALKSTGPKTEQGKKIVAGNALRHGILSAKLILRNESRTEFDALFDELVASLNPVGTMELILVEKVALSLWRQRRLVLAETARIELRSRPKSVAADASELLYGAFSTHKVEPEDLSEPDMEQIEVSREILSEFRALPTDGAWNWREFEDIAPRIYAELLEDAEIEGLPVDEYLGEFAGGLYAYLASVSQRHRSELRKCETFPVIAELANWVIAKKVVIEGQFGDTLARYQSTLDNQLYKALKALREAQQWRLNSLDGSLEKGSKSPANQAA